MTVNIFRPFLTTLCVQSVLSQTLHVDNKNNSGSRLNHQFLMLLTQMRNTINQNYSFMSCLTSMSTCCVAIFISLAICSCMYHDKLPSPRAKNQTKCTALLINHRMANSDFHKYNCEAWYLFFFRRSLDSLCEKQENARTELLRKIPPLQPVHQLHFVLGPNWGQKIEYNRWWWSKLATLTL